MNKNDFLQKIFLQYKTLSTATFVLSNRKRKILFNWIKKENKKHNLLTEHEISLIIYSTRNDTLNI